MRGHQLLGPVNYYEFKRAQKYCRVGVVANTIRLAIRELIIRCIQPIRWKTPSSWKLVLSEKSSVSAYTCASLYALAYSDSRKDWGSECSIFRVSLKSEIPEEWDQSAWNYLCPDRVDLRSMHLDATLPTNGNECALFGDGGYDRSEGASFSDQVRYF